MLHFCLVAMEVSLSIRDEKLKVLKALEYRPGRRAANMRVEAC